MKLLYVANARIPTEKAHGIQIMKMCEALAGQGADVELVVPTRANAITEDAFAYYGVKPSFKIVRLPSVDFLRFGALGYFVSVWSFLRAARRYAALRPDARVYTREPLAPRFMPDAIVEVHTRSGSRFVRRAIRRARQVVAITRGLKDDLIRDGVAAERVIVLPDGVDLAEFEHLPARAEAREKLGLPQDAQIALYAGSFSLYSWKGVDVFFESAKLVPGVLFVGVGGTEEEAKALAPALPQNVRSMGRVPHAAVPRYLRAADVLVLPNKAGDPMSERYTSPLKLFEYMASGTPVVASDLPSIREALSAETATFVRSNDAAALADGIRAVLENPEAAAARALRARETVARYAWSARAARILTLFAP